MAITIIIFALGCAVTVAWRLRDRARAAEQRDRWYLVGLFCMLLETEAMKARDRERARQHQRPE